MPDFAARRDAVLSLVCRHGGAFMVALDGTPGEASHVLIGIEDPDTQEVLRRQFSADAAEDIANNLLELAQLLRDGK